MKKNLLIILLFIAVVICFIITITNNEIKTTELVNVKIDNLTIGTKEDKIDLTKYTESDRFSGNYKYKFEEILIGINNKKEINYLYGRIDEEKIDITFNGKNIESLNDVVNILGQNYHKKNYDSEQQLKEYIYKDYSNHINLEVVYSTNDNNVYWIILSELK